VFGLAAIQDEKTAGKELPRPKGHNYSKPVASLETKYHQKSPEDSTIKPKANLYICDLSAIKDRFKQMQSKSESCGHPCQANWA